MRSDLVSTKAVHDLTPVLIGVAEIQQRIEDPLLAKEALSLMVDAVQAAAVDAVGFSAEGLLSEIQQIAVPQGLWEYRNPAGAIAGAIGAKKALSIYAQLGILQQSLFAQACEQIGNGQLELAVVVGGEAKYRGLRAQITGVQIEDSQQSSEPDVTLKPEAEFWDEVESAAGLGMPVGYYAIMESALRAELGQSLDENRDQLADMYQRFAEVAKTNPNAWHRDGMSATAIRNPSSKNKMLAFPYTKFHNTQWNVDQAGALIFCSAAKARELGVPEEKWVFPLSSAESNVMINLSQRSELQGSPGAKLSGEAALAAAGLQIGDVDYLDMYSCFPSAVKVYARALGIELDRQLTVTGGMTFGGGPLNNYVLQSTCRMAALLRDNPESVGLVSSVSGMLTKQAWGLWSTLANPKGFASIDVSEQVRSGWPVLEVVPPSDGQATIAGYTVEYQAGQPKRLIAVCNLGGGRRTVVYSERQSDLELALADECVGVQVHTNSNGQCHF